MVWIAILAATLLLVSAPAEAQKRCNKGKPCGNTCIAQNKTCRIGTGAERPASETQTNDRRADASAATMYTTGGVRLRYEPSADATILTTIPAGTPVRSTGCGYGGGKWCAVTYSGLAGYVSAQYLGSSYVAPVAQQASTTSRSSAASRGYYRGPRGGCYTYTSSGRKRYVDRSLCD